MLFSLIHDDEQSYRQDVAKVLEKGRVMAYFGNLDVSAAILRNWASSIQLCFSSFKGVLQRANLNVCLTVISPLPYSSFCHWFMPSQLICNYIGGYDWVSTMPWSGMKAFNSAPREPWALSNGTTAGEVQAADGLSFVLVDGAGHMVPMVRFSQM